MIDPQDLRKELLLAPMKDNFTFSRDELLYLLESWREDLQLGTGGNAAMLMLAERCGISSDTTNVAVLAFAKAIRESMFDYGTFEFPESRTRNAIRASIFPSPIYIGEYDFSFHKFEEVFNKTCKKKVIT